MKAVRTISLRDVRKKLRECSECKVWNVGGWSVFDDAKGKRFYVIDDESMKPITYFHFQSSVGYKQVREYLLSNQSV